jgi:hypothetical protein
MCSRIFWNDDGKAAVLPAHGVKREGTTGKNALAWTAKVRVCHGRSERGWASGCLDVRLRLCERKRNVIHVRVCNC